MTADQYGKLTLGAIQALLPDWATLTLGEVEDRLAAIPSHPDEASRPRRRMGAARRLEILGRVDLAELTDRQRQELIDQMVHLERVAQVERAAEIDPMTGKPIPEWRRQLRAELRRTQPPTAAETSAERLARISAEIHAEPVS